MLRMYPRLQGYLAVDQLSIRLNFSENHGVFYGFVRILGCGLDCNVV